MRQSLAIIAIFASLITPVSGQTGTTIKPTQFPYVVQTMPVAIPTSFTLVMAACTTNQNPSTGCLPNGVDAYVCYVDLVGTGQTITIEDNQSTPVTWIAAPLGSAGTPTSWMFSTFDDARCRRMPGGVLWKASTTGATGYITIKHN